MEVDTSKMKKVSVSSIYPYTTISHNNNEAWALLLEYIQKNNEPTLFDFKGIILNKPWWSEKFKEFLAMDNVFIQLYYCEVECNTINLLYAMDVGKRVNGRIIEKAYNSNPVVENLKPAKKESQTDKIAEELQSYFDEKKDGIVRFRFIDRISQLGKNATADYLIRAVEINSERSGNKHYLADLKRSFIIEGTIGYLVNKQEELNKRGIMLEINHEEPKIAEKFRLFKHINDFAISDEDRLNVIKNEIKENQVGMLIKYRPTRASKTDSFGRAGDGEIVRSRAAIYCGLVDKDGTSYLRFVSFNSETLFTKLQWQLDNDGEELSNLDYDVEYIPYTEIGIFNRSMGLKYHFSRAIQSQPDVFFNMVLPNGTSYSATIPERIKIVFDDWGIKYDKESLDEDIAKTNEILNLK